MPGVIEVAPGLSIGADELSETFMRASGPGGQNVNKVSTAVELRFDAAASPTVSPELRARLRAIAGRRLTQGGVLIVTCQRHRTQERNRAEAHAALLDLLRRASVRPVRRIKTRPTMGSERRRLAAKAHRAAIKRGRAADE